MFVAPVPAQTGQLVRLDPLEHLPVGPGDLGGELLWRDGQHLEEGWLAAPTAAGNRPRQAGEGRGDVRDAYSQNI